MLPVEAAIEATDVLELLQVPPVTLVLKAYGTPVQMLLIPEIVSAFGMPGLTTMD
jgi:hypothetical protein